MPTTLTDLNNFHEHPIYQLGDKVAEICAPLFNNFPISYFSYGYIYVEEDAVNVSILLNNQCWLDWYLQNKVCFLTNRKNIHTWLSSMSPKARVKAATNFNHYNGIVLEKQHSDCIEAIEFAASTPHTTALELCANKELLNQFILYFKDKASNIIKVIEREPLCLPKSKFPKLYDPDQPYVDFCQAIKTKRLPFKFNSQEVIFTRREFEIMSLLIKGKSMREVARVLKISPRTVEAYLYKAKNKTNMYTVSRLLDQFSNSLF